MIEPDGVLNDFGWESMTFVLIIGCTHSAIVAQTPLICQYLRIACSWDQFSLRNSANCAEIGGAWPTAAFPNSGRSYHWKQGKLKGSYRPQADVALTMPMKCFSSRSLPLLMRQRTAYNAPRRQICSDSKTLFPLRQTTGAVSVLISIGLRRSRLART